VSDVEQAVVVVAGAVEVTVIVEVTVVVVVVVVGGAVMVTVVVVVLVNVVVVVEPVAVTVIVWALTARGMRSAARSVNAIIARASRLRPGDMRVGARARAAIGAMK
jgi:hypothetical protein